MWRYLAGAVGALLLVAAGVLVFRSSASSEPILPKVQPLASAQAADEAIDDEPLPSASKKTREEKRFNRVDKNKNGIIAREEYLMARRKAFAKLDTNGDGKLSFDEWAIKTTQKFAGADADKSGTLTRVEFATTAVKRKARPRVACPPQAQEAEAD